LTLPNPSEHAADTVRVDNIGCTSGNLWEFGKHTVTPSWSAQRTVFWRYQVCVSATILASLFSVYCGCGWFLRDGVSCHFSASDSVQARTLRRHVLLIDVAAILVRFVSAVNGYKGKWVVQNHK